MKISLKCALACVCAINLLVGCWMLVVDRPRRREQRIAAQLEKLGYRCQWGLRRPAWLRENFPSYGKRVVRVSGPEHLPQSASTCDESRRIGLRHLSYLESVDLRQPALVKDLELSELVGLQQIRSVDLCEDRHVCDSDMAHLAKLKNLECLNIDGTRVSDAGLEELRAATSLKHLSLSGTQVTDAGLDALTQLPKLEELVLVGTKVTDKGIAKLAACPNLNFLQLRDVHFASISWIHPYNNSTEVTPEGIAKLKAQRPGLRIRCP